MQESVRADLLADIIREKEIRTLFQPIVDVTRKCIIGFEALSRGPRGTTLENPVALFDAAAETGLLWELESTCRSLAIERADGLGSGQSLFLNVDPRVIHDKNFVEGYTTQLLKSHRVKPGQIIFEITERTAIDDYMAFLRVLGHYTGQGYRIAVDDVGAGHSGMLTITEIRPHFIKLDMALIRNIQENRLKQAVCRAMVELCRTANMKLIAEGVETTEEMDMLIKMDVQLMQGYFFGKPAESMEEHVRQVKGLFAAMSRTPYVVRREMSFFPVGLLAHKGSVISHDTPAKDVLELFKRKRASGVVVLREGKPQGLIMAGFLSRMLSSPYGYAVALNRSVSHIMDPDFMAVDYETPLPTVAREAMARDEERLYDYIVIVKAGKYYGRVRVKDLVLKLGELDYEHARHLNPLTGLAGNVIIEKRLSQLASTPKDMAVFYIDIDRFKVYNDTHGFEYGDKVITFTADLIERVMVRVFGADVFVGHIGGDDFVATTELDAMAVSSTCQQIIDEFDREIGRFVSRHPNGRYSIRRPSISIAVLYGNNSVFTTPGVVGHLASEVKSACKKDRRSCFIIRDLLHNDNLASCCEKNE